MRHRTFGIDCCDVLERLPRLRVGHVMKQGNCSIEFLLGFLGTGDWKVDRAQVMSRVLVRLSRTNACTARKQKKDYAAGESERISVIHKKFGSRLSNLSLVTRHLSHALELSFIFGGVEIAFRFCD